MNIKYKHPSKFSTPGLYFMPLSWHNKHISFSLPNSAAKMNLSPLYKIICQHYMCWWIIHEGSARVSAPSESWRRQSWQTPRFSSRKKAEDLLKNSSFENEISSLILTLKGAYSRRHEDSSNEDAGSFDLYSIVIIDSSEMIPELHRLDFVPMS